MQAVGRWSRIKGIVVSLKCMVILWRDAGVPLSDGVASAACSLWESSFCRGGDYDKGPILVLWEGWNPSWNCALLRILFILRLNCFLSRYLKAPFSNGFCALSWLGNRGIFLVLIWIRGDFISVCVVLGGSLALNLVMGLSFFYGFTFDFIWPLWGSTFVLGRSGLSRRDTKPSIRFNGWWGFTFQNKWGGLGGFLLSSSLWLLQHLHNDLLEPPIFREISWPPPVCYAYQFGV